MIILQDKYTKEPINFEITIFPDKTSQAWKIDENANLKNGELVWFFENEAELIHLLQLNTVLEYKEITIPYYPYARQDKPVSNTTTFAKSVFESILLNAGINTVYTFDIHSNIGILKVKPLRSVYNFHSNILLHDLIIYPDAGAVERYEAEKRYTDDGIPFLYADKKRNQLTGRIEGLKLNRPIKLEGKKVLVIDDLCDAGGTFIALAEILKEFNLKQLDLCVSHGIFSKGLDVLYNAGYSKIYTTNSLIKNSYIEHNNLIVYDILNVKKPTKDRYERKMI